MGCALGTPLRDRYLSTSWSIDASPLPTPAVQRSVSEGTRSWPSTTLLRNGSSHAPPDTTQGARRSTDWRSRSTNRWPADPPRVARELRDVVAHLDDSGNRNDERRVGVHQVTKLVGDGRAIAVLSRDVKQVEQDAAVQEDDLWHVRRYQGVGQGRLRSSSVLHCLRPPVRHERPRHRAGHPLSAGRSRGGRRVDGPCSDPTSARAP